MIIRLIFFLILAYLLYRVIKGFFRSAKQIHKSKSSGVIDEMVQDPLCKTYIPRREAFRKTLKGQEHFFCSKECADRFEARGN